MAEVVDKRVSFTVNLTPKAREIADGLRVDTGIPNTTAIERLLEWFLTRPRKFRLGILQGEDASRDELLVDWFREHMAARGLKVELLDGQDVDARIRQIRKLLDEIFMIHAGVRGAAQEATANKKKRG